MVRWRICKSLYFLVFCFVVIPSFFYLPHVQAATLTVCASGCNHATIQAAVNAAIAGDTITVSAGTYTETLTITKNLTVNGAGIDSTIIDANKVARTVDVTGGAVVTLSGMTIKNPKNDALDMAIIYIDQSNVTLSNIKATYSENPAWTVHGIFVKQSTVNFSDLVISINDADGASCGIYTTNSGGASALTVRNSLIKGYGGYGIWIMGNPNPSTANISFVTMDGLGNGDYGVRSDFSSTVTVSSSIIANHSGACTLGTMTLKYSDCFTPGAGTSNGNIQADPLFVDSANGDYTLQAGSPAINKGDPHNLDLDATRSDMGHTGGKGASGNVLKVALSGIGGAFTAISGALDAAVSGDTIRVAGGSYGAGIAISNTSINLTIEGGYNAANWARDVAANDTILNGVSVTNHTGAITVDGVTVTGSSGQGVYVSSANTNFTVNNCKIHDNASTGIYFHSVGNATISNNSVYSNVSFGGITVQTHTQVTISGNTVHSNACGNSTCNGIYITTANSNDTISGNTSYNNYSGINIQGAAANSAYNITSNITYSNTEAGIYIFTGSPLVKNNISYSNAYGILFGSTNDPLITNNVFAGNSQNGIRFTGGSGSPTIKNNIVYNSGSRGIEFCSGWSSSVFPSTIRYNCFYGNTYGNIMHCSDDTANPGSYSNELPGDFSDMNRPAWSDYNLKEDPGFVEAVNHDYHLKATSFLVDEGDPADAVGNEPEDNGNRINIGAYGNTASARTAQAAPTISNITGLQDGGNVIISMDTNTATDKYWVKAEYWDGNAYQTISQAKISGNDYVNGYKTDTGRIRSGAGRSIIWNTNGALFNGSAFSGQNINNLKVRLTVEHNNQSASDVSPEFVFDGTKPVISITSPGNNIYIATKQPDFTATASSTADGGVSNVKFQYKITTDQDFTDISTDTSADYAAVWGGISLTAGQSYNLKAIATNPNSSASSSTVNVTVCSYSLSSDSAAFESAGSSSQVTLTPLASCIWSAASNDAWIVMDGGGIFNSGSTMTAGYTVLQNTGPARTGTMTFADKTFTVTQASGCTYLINSNSSNAIAGGANGSISVTTNTGTCPWTAASNAAWISVTSGGNGTGNAATGYSVAANTGPARSGTITIAGHTFTLNQASGCTYTISPASSSPTAAGATANVTVTSSDGCPWTASSNAAWISISSGANGSGNGTASYTVTANPNAGPRTGILTIAGQTFTVTQSGSSCAYSLSADSKAFGLSGGSDSVNVTATPSDCAWTATSNAAWLTISAGSSGTGNGTVTYSASANSGSNPRNGAITIGGQTFTVTQAGVTCSQILLPASKSFGLSGGSDSIAVTSAASDCAWTAASNETWITVSSGKNSTGNGTINYAIAANTSVSARNGSISVGPQTFAITQAGASCTYTISPTGKALTSSGGSDSITVTPSVSDCTWTAAGNESWISVTAGSSGTGNGTVSYTVSENAGPGLRNGAITIADKTYTITQDGFTVTSPQQFTLTVSAAGDGSGTVTSSLAGIDCGPDCSEAYNSGTSLVLTAVAGNGSAFTGWANCANISGSTCTVTVTSDTAISASFAAVTDNQYVLTIDKTGNGSGTVTSSDGEIDCGSDCDESGAVYDAGKQVTLTATVATGSTFGGWTGDACNGSKVLTCKVTMDSDKSISVSFKAHPIVTVLKSGNGDGTLTSSPKGISCGLDCVQHEYAFKRGQTILLRAKPDTGSRFISWSGDVCNGSKAQICKITKISDDREVTAQFGQPDMSVSDQAITFDDTLKAQTTSKIVTVTNNGDAPLTLKSIKIISGSDLKSVPSAKMFKVYSGLNGKLITVATIPAESDLDLIVKFRPTSTGQKTATLRITSDDTDNQLAEIQLSGTGISANPPASPFSKVGPNLFPTLTKGGEGGFDEFVSREEAAAIIVKSLELGVRSQGPNSELSTLDSQLSCETSPFIDVFPDRWSCKYIKRLQELGVSGCDETRFCPEDYITREEMAYLIVSSQLSIAISLMPEDHCMTGSPFIDVPADSWSCKYIKRLYELGLTEEKDGQMFRPEDFVTKEQLETILLQDRN